jgi:hypothetical protein
MLINPKVEYEFAIHTRGKDRMSIRVTGESVSFEKASDSVQIRPRHIRLVASLQGLMRDFMRGETQASEQPEPQEIP